VSDLRVFRLDADGRDVELRGSTVALECELQGRVEASMEAMLSIRFLASEYPTGPWHRGRVDSLGLDENNTPVVIEYKKGSDHGVLSQAVSYLSWLRSARHEFEALVKERLGAEVAEAIDWRNPRMVCIAADFSHHDRVAVHDLGKRIDLVRYRVFEDGLLSLLLVESAPGTARPAPGRHQPQEPEVLAEADTGTAAVQPNLVEVPACLRALYDELDAMLTTSGEVEVEAKQHYIAYRRLVNVACVVFRPKHEAILTYLKVDPNTVELEEGFTRDMRGIGHLGTGDLEVRIASVADLGKAGPLIRRAFEAG
jgi:predicted transport protein